MSRTAEERKWIQFLFETWDTIKVNNDAEWRFGADSDGWRKESHVPYIGDYHPMHVMNLYYPSHHQGKLPTIIYIHGGGWLYGVVDDSERYLGWLASQGYAVMAMNYRLLQETDLQGLVQDIFTAMHWLAAYGPDRGFDLSRVLLTGDSAGGHLTNLVACIRESKELQLIYEVKPFDFSLSALCVSCPCAETDRLYINGDPGTEMGDGTAKAYRQLLLGEQDEDAPWAKHMSASETIPGLTLPPLLLIGSENESLHEQTRYLLQTLEDSKQKYEAIIWEKKDGPHLIHVFNISHWEWRESLISNRKMLDFFDRMTQ